MIMGSQRKEMDNIHFHLQTQHIYRAIAYLGHRYILCVVCEQGFGGGGVLGAGEGVGKSFRRYCALLK